MFASFRRGGDLGMGEQGGHPGVPGLKGEGGGGLHWCMYTTKLTIFFFR